MHPDILNFLDPFWVLSHQCVFPGPVWLFCEHSDDLLAADGNMGIRLILFSNLAFVNSFPPAGIRGLRRMVAVAGR